MGDHPSTDDAATSRDHDSSVPRRSYLRSLAAGAALAGGLGGSAVGTGAAEADYTDVPGHPLPLSSYRDKDVFTTTMAAAKQNTLGSRNEYYADTGEGTVGLLIENGLQTTAATMVEIGVPFRIDLEPDRDLEIVLDAHVDADVQVEGDTTAEFNVGAYLMQLSGTGDPLYVEDPPSYYVLDNTLFHNEEVTGADIFGSTTITEQHYTDGSGGNPNPFYLQADHMSEGDVYRVGVFARGVANHTLDPGVASIDCHPNLGGYSGEVSLNAVYLNWDGVDKPPEIEGNQPTDPDGDGLYEDLNGNGDLDSDDVVTYFNNMENPNLADHPEYYDYNGNGQIDYDDVTQLFNEI